MAFHYHHALGLRAVFPELYTLIKKERRGLPPQTPQTIVVGNLDTESYLQSAFLEKDGILMGVEFPFLESALENFFQRASTDKPPAANQNWFSPSTLASDQKNAGMLEFELATLAVIQNPQHAKLLKTLGYPKENLNALKNLALAHKLALKFREYLLHVPDQILEPDSSRPITELWQLVHTYLSEKGYTSPLIHPDRFHAACRNFAAAAKTLPKLYLFGMPILSVFHVRMLAALSLCADVYLMGVDLKADGVVIFPGAASKFSDYRKVLNAAAHEANLELKRQEIPMEPLRQNNTEFWSLPGLWRGAEILGDHWHERMLQNPAQRQTDIHVVLTDLSDDFAAFEKALAARMLTATSRTRLYEKPEPNAELVAILAEAASSPDRALILRYWDNAAVRKAFALDADKVALYRRALESAQGFRNDYPDNQTVFNISESTRRLMRSALVTPSGDIPAVAIREFDTAEYFAAFLRCLDLLLTIPARLGSKTGHALIAALKEIWVEYGLANDEDGQQFDALLTQIQHATPAAGLGFPQLAKIVGRFSAKRSLKQSSGREGVLFSSPSATAFTADTITFFDLSEDLDQADESDPFLPEYSVAPTRLTQTDLMHISFEGARHSGATRVIYAVSGVDPIKGAEKYPSHALTAFRAFLEKQGFAPDVKEKFAATVLESGYGDNPPLASAADAKSAALLHSNGKKKSLSATLLPMTGQAAVRTTLSVSDLENFLLSPTRFTLGSSGPANADPVEFRREEPKLGSGKKDRFKFCEDYLKAILSDGTAGPIIAPSAIMERKQRSGEIPPDGFDETRLILAENQNDRNLHRFAAAQRDAFTVVEYIFRAGISKTFSIRDAVRFERRYMPAPVISGVTITGTIGKFYEEKTGGHLTLIDSAVYPERSKYLVKMYLWLCLCDLGGLTLSTYKLPEKKTKLGILEPGLTALKTIQTTEIDDRQGYLEGLIAELAEGNLFWFDLALITGKKLSSFAESDEAEILELLAADPRGRDAEAAQYLRRFYDLKPTAESFRFFQKFILPVANLDAAKRSADG